MGGAGGPGLPQGQPEGAPDGAGGIVTRSTSAFSIGSTGAGSDYDHDEEKAALTEDGGAVVTEAQRAAGRDRRQPDRDVGASDARTQPARRDAGLVDPSNPEAAAGKGIPGGFNAGPALVERQPRRNMN